MNSFLLYPQYADWLRRLDTLILRDYLEDGGEAGIELLKIIIENILKYPEDMKYRIFSRTKQVISYLESPKRVILLIHFGFQTQVKDFQRKWIWNGEIVKLEQLQIGFDLLNLTYNSWLKNKNKAEVEARNKRIEETEAWRRQQILIQEDREIRVWKSEFISPVVAKPVSISIDPALELKRKQKWTGAGHKL